MSSEDFTETFCSGEHKNRPYVKVLDDFKYRNLKPKDDVEYAVCKMLNYIMRLLSKYRTEKSKKKFKARLRHKKEDELKVKSLKITNNTSSFRALLRVEVEETIVD